MKTLIIDPGYSSFKWARVEDGKVKGPYREPTAVAEVPDWSLAVDGPGEAGGIEMNGKRYLVGEEALISGLPLPTLADGFLYGTALPLFLKKLTEEKKPETVVVLISPADFGLLNRVEETVRRILPEARFLAMVQGTGVWVEAERPGAAIIIDIGFNTVDCIPVMNGKLRRDLCFALKGAGLVSFLEKVERDDPFSLARRLEEGDERLAALVREHYWGWLERMLAARGEWRRRPTGIPLIFGGGGARFLKKVKGARVVKDPETANVRGVARLIKESTGGEKHEGKDGDPGRDGVAHTFESKDEGGHYSVAS